MNSSSFISQRLWLGAALFILGSVMGGNLYSDRISIDARERERLATQARVIDENLGRQLVATHLGLNTIRGDLPYLKAQKDATALVNRRLQAMRDATPGMRAVTIFDKNGTLIARNPDRFIGQNFKDRDYFQIAIHGMNPDILYVSQPFLAETNEYVINLVRILVDENGAFDGIILASLDPGYFSILLASVSYAPDMWTCLAHGDGKLFLKIPAPPVAGEDDPAKPGHFDPRFVDAGQKAAILIGSGFASGQERSLVALRTIRPAEVPMSKSLVLAVGRNLPDVFAEWHRNVAQQCGLFALLALVAGFGLFFQQRRRRAYELLLAEKEIVRKQAEADLRIAAVAFESQEGMVVTDADEVILRVNRAFTEISGYTAEELIGKTPRLLRSPRHDAEFHHAMAETIRQTGGWQGEIWDRRKDGTDHPNWLMVSAVKGGDGIITHFVVSQHDITERKRFEEDLREKNRVLEQFTNVLAHHLQEPVRKQLVFTSRLGQLLEAHHPDQDVQQALAHIKRGAERLRLLLR
ncbi:MAG TPA: PAS domain S-box protein, partial [Rhodospirillaceae bacterium]|nr:PAS domain S-box protein [Rhodospirillaceae bacterium]